MRAVLAATAALLAGGCTLIGVGSFELPTCASSDDCAALNAHYGIDAESACTLYQCAPATARCEIGERDLDGDGERPPECGGVDCNDRSGAISPSMPEVCDGLDNDCDARVDEEGGAELRRGAVSFSATGVRDVAWTAPGASAPAIVWTDGDTGVLAEITGGESSPIGFLYQPVEDPLTMPALVEGCPRPGETGVASAVCHVAEAAVAEADEQALFAAVISDRGCAGGQLRLGRIDDRADASVVQRGPAVRSNVYLGVDVDWAGDACTGASREAGAARGAARVAIASQPIASPGAPGAPPPRQALAAWIGDDLARSRCGGSEVPVEVLGLWSETGTSGGETIHWVTGTQGGIPQTLGTTTGGGAPAIAAWPERGFWVAYGRPDGDLALHHLPLVADPPPLSPTARPDDERPTEALAIAPPSAILAPERAAIDHVSIAIADGAGDTARLGIAWLEGCGESDTAIVMAIVDVDGAGGATASAREVVAEGEVGAPVIASLPGGLPSGSEGWLVAWRERDGTVALRRLSSATGAFVDAAPLRLAASGGRDSALAAYRVGQEVRLSFAEESTVADAGLACSDRTSGSP